MAILQLKGICKDYFRARQPVRVLEGIDLTVDEGEYVAVMGPSGSGKTTLMNIIGCLDTPNGGEYLLCGKDLANLSDDALADIRGKYIGFVFQNFYLLPRLSALDNVALPLLYAGVSLKERRRRAAAALESVGLSDRAAFLPNQLSGGQCQRVAIARALINNPMMLFADEPTGNLDRTNADEVLRLLLKIRETRGQTLLMVTHDLSIAEKADRIFRMDNGVLSLDRDYIGGNKKTIVSY